jgi:CubicO group peptidase (beta-lactamase class C family)
MDGEERDLIDALDYFKTDGLIILHDGALLYENYWQGNSKDQKHISWSVAKSFLSALIGIAYHDGLIEDLNDPITKYLKDFNDTGYADIPIKDILQMSSGIIFNEDYADYNSDINKFARALAQGTSMRDFAKNLKNGKQPGTFNHYVSIDTQMLAMLLEEVTGEPVAKNLEAKIWTKIGMEHDAYYMVDDTGAAWALGGLNATLRDYAKFGQLYLNNGKWDNQQIVPEDWVHASHKPDGPHLQPGENELSSSSWGYGYQWWVPGFPSSDYLAAGIYNQYIYIDPMTNVVIAKTSSNYKFNQERQYSKDAHVAMFRAIAKRAAETFE